MKTIKFTTILMITMVLACNCTLNAQSKTGRKIEKVGKDVDEANDALNKGKELFKGVFGKKNKKQSDNTRTSESEQNQEAINNIEEDQGNKAKEEGQQSLKPGDVHPDAVVLDVDKLYDFHEGAAIVEKGSSTALINAKGEFLVPFNTYDFLPNDSYNGFFLIRRTYNTKTPMGFVNRKGKFIQTEKGQGVVFGNYFLVGNNGNNLDTRNYFYDLDGKRFVVSGHISAIERFVGDGLVQISINNPKGGFLKGYKNLMDEWVIQPQYQWGSVFNEGAAVVGDYNEFGELKYGFIDIKGNPITPLQFTRPPGLFHNGLAKVFYKEPAKYSFINKKGEVVFTDQGIPYFNDFNLGYSFKKSNRAGESVIMDNKLKIHSDMEFLQMFGISGNVKSTTLVFPHYSYTNRPIESSMILFTLYDGKKLYGGFLFPKSKTGVYGNFITKIPGTGELEEFYFDSISGLKHMHWKKSNDIRDGGADIIDGYVNQNGVFMIIKGEASKW